MKLRMRVLVLLGGVCFYSVYTFADFSEKAKAKIESYFNLELWEENPNSHGQQIMKAMKKDGSLDSLNSAEQKAFLSLIRTLAKEKQEAQLIDQQIEQNKGADTSNGCPNFLKDLLNNDFKPSAKKEDQPLEERKTSFRQRAQERLKNTVAAVRIATGKANGRAKTNAQGLGGFFRTSCKPLFERYQGTCSEQNPCAPSPSRFTGVERLKTAMRVLTSSDGKIPASQTLDSCVLDQFLEETQSLLANLDYANMTPDDFKQLRDYYFQILNFLNQPENKALKKVHGPQIQTLLSTHDPYGLFGQAEELVEKLCRITSNPDLPEPHDVRSLVLIEDTLNNLSTQKKINSLLKMRDNLEDSSFDIKKLGCFLDSEKDGRKFQNLALKTLTYLGSREKNYPELNEGLQKKLNTLAHLGYSAEGRPRAKGEEEKIKYAPRFTADEAWLIDHQVDSYQRFTSQLLKSRIFEMPTAAPLKKAIETKFNSQRKAMLELEKATFQNYQPGDIILQSIDRLHEYKGKKRDGDTHKQKVLTRADVQHAGLFLANPEASEKNGKPAKKTMLHSLDSSPDEVSGVYEPGIAMDDLEFGEEYYSTGFRFNFNQLFDPELVRILKKKKLDPEVWLRGKLVEINAKYQQGIKKDFDPEKPRYRIANHLAARSLSVLPKAFHGAVLRLLKKETESTKEQEEIERAADIDKKKRALDRSEKKDLLELRVKNKRTFAPRGERSDATHEICSEFAFTEAIRYLLFVDEKLRRETEKYFTETPLQIPQIEVEFSKLHTGTLYRILLDLEKKGLVTRVLPPSGLFATRK